MTTFCFRQLLAVALCFLCPLGNMLKGQSPFIKEYFNPSSESDQYVKLSFNSAINGTSDNSYRIISAGIKNRYSPVFGSNILLELCFLKEDGTGRSVNPMKEIPLVAKSGSNLKVIQIISNTQGHYIFLRSGDADEGLSYIRVNANGDLLSAHDLIFGDSNPYSGKVTINQVIPGPTNSVAMVGTIGVNYGSTPDRVFFAIVNISTHVITSQRQYMIDADLVVEADTVREESLNGLSLLRFGTAGYFIAGHNGWEAEGQPFLMRVGPTGDFMWFRNWDFVHESEPLSGYFNDAKAMPNMRLFSANDGAGGTYYGLIYGVYTFSLHLIRFNPNVISGSGIWDNRLITGLPGNTGDSYLTAVYSGFSFPKLVGAWANPVNSSNDYGSAFFSYNLLTNTGNVYSIFNLSAPLPGMTHSFTRNIVGGKPNLINNTAQIFVGGEARNTSSNSRLQHLFVKTNAIGAGPYENFDCHAGSQLVSANPDIPVAFNMGVSMGLSNYVLVFGPSNIAGSNSIPFAQSSYCSSAGLQSGETTDRDQSLNDMSEDEQTFTAESARVKIYNIAGQLICEGVNLTTAGCRELLRDQPSGIYLMERATATGEMSVEKVFHQKQ